MKTFRLVPLLAVVGLASCGSPQSKFSGTAEEHRSALVPSPVITYAAERGLVDVRSVLPDVVCDLRYATKKNVTGQALYPPDMPCLLNQRTAEKLRHAQDLLKAQGFGLKIWDAWRPPEVQVELFRYGGHTNMFLDPKVAWSFHCSGTSVDVTLVDHQGRELPLPTYFDEASPKANIYTPIPDARARHNIYILQKAMIDSGFTLLDMEWWHFDDGEFHNVVTRLPVVFAQEIGLKLPLLK